LLLAGGFKPCPSTTEPSDLATIGIRNPNSLDLREHRFFEIVDRAVLSLKDAGSLPDLKTLERRMRDRIIAVRMGIGFVKEAETGQIPAGLKRLSIRSLTLDGWQQHHKRKQREDRPKGPLGRLADHRTTGPRPIRSALVSYRRARSSSSFCVYGSRHLAAMPRSRCASSR
jgi:hypothetical protein